MAGGCWRGGGLEAASAFRPNRAAVWAGVSCIDIVWLKKRKDYLRTQSGRKWRTPSLILTMRAREGSEQVGEGVSRFGCTVTKRIGNAVRRNRVKRRLREAIRLAAPDSAQAGFDYVIIARRSALDTPFGDIVEEMGTALQQVHAS